jgi:hypothetical protein
VRAALWALIGHAGLAAEGPRLVSALGASGSEEVKGAREGLVALGPDAALPLLVGVEFGGPVQREAAVEVLRELDVDAETLEALRARQLAGIQQTILLRAAVEDLPGAASSLLRRRLEERVSEGLGALIDLLAALYRDPRLSNLERQLRRSVAGRGLDLLIEALEALLNRDEHRAIVPLLEAGGGWVERGAAAARELGRTLPEHAAALAELRESADATTRSLAAAISLEVGDSIGDPGPMPSAMELAIRLQESPAFDRLDTQRLMGLAGLLQERKLAEGERVYAIGDEGPSLYFVLEGEVELRRGSLVLDRIGVDAFFGELSTLDGVPRSEEAIAASATRLVQLDRDDLLPLLEEVPALAIGLAQFLSGRVRRLEDRLEEAAAPSGLDDE